MEDKVKNTTEEHGVMTVTLKNGQKIPVKAKTVYTHWESGRKDCAIIIEEPLNGTSTNEN
jgi:hypothetical protein